MRASATTAVDSRVSRSAHLPNVAIPDDAGSCSVLPVSASDCRRSGPAAPWPNSHGALHLPQIVPNRPRSDAGRARRPSRGVHGATRSSGTARHSRYQHGPPRARRQAPDPWGFCFLGFFASVAMLVWITGHRGAPGSTLTRNRRTAWHRPARHEGSDNVLPCVRCYHLVGAARSCAVGSGQVSTIEYGTVARSPAITRRGPRPAASVPEPNGHNPSGQPRARFAIDYGLDPGSCVG
jgi:hypothetical protein